MTGHRRWVRGLLAVGCVVGILNAYGLATSQPAQIGIATDVYHHAGSAILAGENPYLGTPSDHPGFHYLYPPVILVAMLPYGLLGDPGLAYALQTVLNLLTAAALAGTVLWTLQAAGADLERLDRGLLAAYTLCWFPSASTVVMGQVNLQLALGIALGTILLERSIDESPVARRGPDVVATLENRRSRLLAGVSFALVALVKLFPALVGAWLLRLRAWRTVLAALVTAIGGLLLGAGLFGPDLTVHYITETLARELSVATFADGPNPESPYMTVRRQFAALVPGIPSAWLLPAALAVLAPVVAASYRRVDTLEYRLLALHATLLATLIAFPLEPFYLGLTVYPMATLIYLLKSGMARRIYLVGVLVVSIPIWLGELEIYLALAPAGLEATLVGLARGFYSVAMPMMVGVWAMLAGIVLRQRPEATTE